MAFTIPDESSAGHADQAEPKTLDFQALARRDVGVVSGCLVTAQGVPNMTVAVASGAVRIAGTSHAVTGANVTITANVTANPRYDAVVSDSSGVLSAIAGTPAAEATLDQPGVDLNTYAVLAIVYVAPGATAINTAEIVQKQMALNPDASHNYAHALNDTGAHTGPIDDAQIPVGIARDAEVTTAVSTHTAASDPHGDRAAAATDAGTQVSTHAAASDPHTTYQKESEKGVASGYAGLDSNAVVPAAQLPMPTSTLLGGVKSKVAVTHEFLTSIGTDGLPVGAQPTLSDISGLLDSSFALTGDISPTALSGNVNDYNPTGLASASTIRFSTSDGTPRAVSGIVGGTDGRLLFLHNLGPGNVVLLDDSALSTAGNRIALTNGNLEIVTDALVMLQYDFTSQRWRASVPSDIVQTADIAGMATTTDVANLLTTSFALTADISPTAISANVNDYAPTGLATAATLRLSTNDGTARAISGLTGGADGRLLIVYNLGPGVIALLDESSLSTAANRFALDGNVNLPPDVMTILQYDAAGSRWHAIHKASGTTPALAFDSTAAAGTSQFFMRADDQIAIFDATNPVAEGTAATGSAAFAARRDHVHPRAAEIVVTFSKQGTIAVTTDSAALRWYNDTGRTLTIVAVRISLVTVNTGATVLVDVNKDGTTIFTTQGNRPSITASQSPSTTKVTNQDVTTIADASYLTANIDQIGSTIAGSDLTIQVLLRG